MSKAPRGNPHEDFALEQRLGTLLRSGVIISAAVTLIGGIMYLAVHGGAPATYHTFRGEPAPLRSVGGVIAGVLRGESISIIQLGVLLLIATPIARVLISVIGFARERDWMYVACSLLVLVLLFFSLLHGG
jgi:Predicted membrane protein